MQINFSILVSNTSRSCSYLKEFKKNKLEPESIIYLDDKSNNKYFRILKKKKFFFPKIKVNKFYSKNISKRISNFIYRNITKIIVYSGYPGVILKYKKTLKNNFFLHSHSGKLPKYKGSTTIYYTLLNEKKIYCSTILMNDKIDEGKILLIKNYNLPKNIKEIDKDFDDLIRSKNLVFLLKNFNLKKKVKLLKHNYKPYYVIHPVLRSAVFKKYEKNF
jgi:methionyl-tRNA formyltransferase